MKRFIAMLLVFIMAVCLLTGCGSNTEPAKEETAKTVVTLASMYTLPEFEAGFEAAYPEIDLQVEKMATGVINGEIARRLRKGHGPDLFITTMPAGDVANYTYDLSAEAFVEKYQSTITKSVAVDGQNRYLPLPGSYYGYIINKTLLDELGLDMPETTADLLRILATAKEKGIGVTAENGYGFGLSDVGAPFLGAYLTADFATDFLSSAEGAKWLADFSENNASFTGNWESSISFLKECVDNGYMDPNKIIVNYNGTIDSDATAFKAEDNLPDRTAILTFGNLAMLDQISSKTEDEIEMIPCLPDTESGHKLLSAISNAYIAINSTLADTDKLQAALAVLEYLSTEAGQTHWMHDTDCPYSYLQNYQANASSLPAGIRSYVEDNMVFSNPFPTNLLSYVGKCLAEAAKGKLEIGEALAKIDDYYLNGSDDVEYDLSVVGTVSSDMEYVNANTRVQETEIGNFISDAIREVINADVVLVNGGSIRASLYTGDVTGSDLAAVCPYGNLVIISKMDGATLRAAITNGIQKTWKPSGQFLQVSGIRYSFKPAANESETAELVSLCYADGTEIKDDDVMTVAYTNYMGGSNGYVDAGDGFTMLNVYDAATPITVELVEETGKTFGDILKIYFANHKDDELSAKLEGRIEVIQ